MYTVALVLLLPRARVLELPEIVRWPLGPVELVEVHVISLQPAQRPLQRLLQLLPRIGPLTPLDRVEAWAGYLGGDNQVLAPWVAR